MLYEKWEIFFTTCYCTVISQQYFCNNQNSSSNHAIFFEAERSCSRRRKPPSRLTWPCGCFQSAVFQNPRDCADTIAVQRSKRLNYVWNILNLCPEVSNLQNSQKCHACKIIPFMILLPTAVHNGWYLPRRLYLNSTKFRVMLAPQIIDTKGWWHVRVCQDLSPVSNEHIIGG